MITSGVVSHFLIFIKHAIDIDSEYVKMFMLRIQMVCVYVKENLLWWKHRLQFIEMDFKKRDLRAATAGSAPGLRSGPKRASCLHQLVLCISATRWISMLFRPHCPPPCSQQHFITICQDNRVKGQIEHYDDDVSTIQCGVKCAKVRVATFIDSLGLNPYFFSLSLKLLNTSAFVDMCLYLSTEIEKRVTV